MTEQMDFNGREKTKLGTLRPEPVVSSDALPCETNSCVAMKRGMAHAYNLQQQIFHGNVSALYYNGFKTKLVVREKNSVLGSVLHPTARDGVHVPRVTNAYVKVCSAHSRLHLLHSIRRLVEQGSSCGTNLHPITATAILYQGD